jgi:hypothetical protein
VVYIKMMEICRLPTCRSPRAAHDALPGVASSGEAG